MNLFFVIPKIGGEKIKLLLIRKIIIDNNDRRIEE